MKTITEKQALSLIEWYLSEGRDGNWGSWSHNFDLPCSASVLQYDTNQCQINLDETIKVNGEQVNCFTHSRSPVGKKWNKSMTFSELREIFTPNIVREEREVREAAENIARKQVKNYYDNLPEEFKLSIQNIWGADKGRKKRRNELWNFCVANNLKYAKYIPYLLESDTYFPYVNIE